jgi:uncharacterized protein
MLTTAEGETLVRVARQAIGEHLSGKTTAPEEGSTPSLQEKRGVFVTLLEHPGGGLRGCIGLPYPTNPLIEQVKIAAVEAATSDPRFDPIQSKQLREKIVVEVTVLSPMEPIWVRNPLDLRENVEVGRDGLMIESGNGHGLLLPQVAVDEGFDSEEFLSHCCMKADLPPDAWLTPGIRVSRFQGQVFAEENPHGRVLQRHLDQKKIGRK